jgi:hypothetical protein
MKYIYERFFVVLFGNEEGMNMACVADLEALNSGVIRNILRSMANEHWSVAEALDEYDVPEELREEYEAQIEACFVD